MRFIFYFIIIYPLFFYSCTDDGEFEDNSLDETVATLNTRSDAELDAPCKIKVFLGTYENNVLNSSTTCSNLQNTVNSYNAALQNGSFDLICRAGGGIQTLTEGGRLELVSNANGTCSVNFIANCDSWPGDVLSRCENSQVCLGFVVPDEVPGFSCVEILISANGNRFCSLFSTEQIGTSIDVTLDLSEYNFLDWLYSRRQKTTRICEG